mmetsp:Transcript_19836/g.42921  ORF Transcript_19836/g.42921 Transcript_19836/m.42921 type:complete len:213 (-) Transcript_19836:326-964(-)
MISKRSRRQMPKCGTKLSKNRSPRPPRPLLPKWPLPWVEMTDHPRLRLRLRLRVPTSPTSLLQRVLRPVLIAPNPSWRTRSSAENSWSLRMGGRCMLSARMSSSRLVAALRPRPRRSVRSVGRSWMGKFTCSTHKARTPCRCTSGARMPTPKSTMKNVRIATLRSLPTRGPNSLAPWPPLRASWCIWSARAGSARARCARIARTRSGTPRRW